MKYTLACLLWVGGAAMAATPHTPYTLGVFPHLPPAELEEVFAPIAADLGRALGRVVQFRSASTYEAFMDNLNRGAYEIAFVQPFDYVRVAGDKGYAPLATRNESLEVLFVAKDDSPLTGAAGLKGKRLALPPDVAAVSILAKHHLRGAGLNPDTDLTISQHRSHMSCLQLVLVDSAEACGTAAPALRFFEQKMNVKMKVIDRSIAIPHTLFVAHTRVSAAEREQLLKVMLGWKDTEEGRNILERGRLAPFIPVVDADYNVVRRFATAP